MNPEKVSELILSAELHKYPRIVDNSVWREKSSEKKSGDRSLDDVKKS